MAGHAAPRIVQTAAGMLNAIGLQNVGVEDFIERKLPPLKRYPHCKVIVNVFGYTVGDYIGVIERLNQAEGIAAYELNVSCPNVHAGGMAFGADPGSLEYLVGRAKSAAQRPLIVKLSPNVTSIANSWPKSPRTPARTRSASPTPSWPCPSTPRPASPASATSPAASPARPSSPSPCAWSETARAVKIPILGMGGIVTPEDAVEFLLAGATAIQVGTASYADP
jgi:dihydroorotate dehydrogenase (NAD+) catalytic subunit